MRSTQDFRRCFRGNTGQFHSLCDADTSLVDGEEERPYDVMFQDTRSAWLIKTDKEECQSNEMSYPI